MLDAIVIGAGPAGMSAAINLHQRGKTVRVYYVGDGKLSYAEQVDNYLGFPGAGGGEIVRAFRSHVAAQGIEMVKAKVLNVVPIGDHFMVNVGQDIVEASRVILTVGSQSNRTFPGEEALLGRGVSYCATCDGMLYRGKRVGVLAFSKEAAEEANFLHRIGVSVLFLSREAEAAGLSEEIERRTLTEVSIVGEESVRTLLVDGEEIPVDGVFVLRDSIAPTAMVTGLEMEKGFVKVTEKMETNISGLYAAGDCTGAPFQAMKAAGEGQIAGLQAGS